MPKLPACKGKEAVEAFEKHGWSLKKGTLRRLIRDAGLSVNDFAEVLGKSGKRK